MTYLEYEDSKNKFSQAQKVLDDIMTENERLFNETQPKSADPSKILVTGGERINSFDNYLIKKDKARIDERLKEATLMLSNRKILLDLKEKELRLSKNWRDIIYTYYFLDNISIKRISYKIPYSRSRIYDIINEIKDNIKEQG